MQLDHQPWDSSKMLIGDEFKTYVHSLTDTPRRYPAGIKRCMVQPWIQLTETEDLHVCRDNCRAEVNKILSTLITRYNKYWLEIETLEEGTSVMIENISSYEFVSLCPFEVVAIDYSATHTEYEAKWID